MELYLIRHAQSTNNALEDVTQRVADPTLTDVGVQQAQLLAEHMSTVLRPESTVIRGQTVRTEGAPKDDRRVHLYCSPMWRSLLTARPVSKAIGIAPEVWVDIHEHGGIYLDHGAEGGIIGYPGKTRSDILTEFPTCRLPESVTEEGWWQGGLEEPDACYDRAKRVARALTERGGRDECLLLVTHGTFMDHLLKALLGLPREAAVVYIHNNTGITHLEFRGSAKIVAWHTNRIEHLPPQLRT